MAILLTIGWIILTIHNLRSENDQLTQTIAVRDKDISDAVAANQTNVAAINALKAHSLAVERALMVAKKAALGRTAEVTKLNGVIANAQSSNCISPSIIAIVDGVRNYQSTAIGRDKAGDSKTDNTH